MFEAYNLLVDTFGIKGFEKVESLLQEVDRRFSRHVINVWKVEAFVSLVWLFIK